jgi:hypothetical protein
MNGNWKFLIFFCSRGITLSKPADHNQIRTWPVHSYMTNLHMQFESYTCLQTKLQSVNLKFQIFSKFKRGNSVKNQWTITKFELDLRISMTNLHMQFDPYTYIQTKVRERKLKFISRGITLLKIIRTWPNLNLTCIILWCIQIKCVQPFKR